MDCRVWNFFHDTKGEACFSFPILIFPSRSLYFNVHVDALNIALGVILA
jgi:hypothetical protein